MRDHSAYLKTERGITSNGYPTSMVITGMLICEVMERIFMKQREQNQQDLEWSLTFCKIKQKEKNTKLKYAFISFRSVVYREERSGVKLCILESK